MSVLESFNESVESLVSDGRLDAVEQGPAIEAARKLAEMMDGPNWPMVNGKLDNVSPGVFLKYCDALGIVGDKVKPKAAQPKKKPVVNVLAGTKFGKAASG